MSLATPAVPGKPAKDDNGEPIWDVNVEPILKFLLGKKGVKTKECAEAGEQKVTYFRGKDLVPLLTDEDKQFMVARKAQKTLDAHFDGKVFEKKSDVKKLLDILFEKGFIQVAEEVKMSDNAKAKKWPDKLEGISYTKFQKRIKEGGIQKDDDGNIIDKEHVINAFYILRYEIAQKWNTTFLILIVIGILSLAMIQAWPVWAKIGAWYLLLFYIALNLVVAGIRYGWYVIWWFLGFEFWILPNLDDEMLGIVESFKPLYSVERRKDGKFMLLGRVLVLGMLAVACEQISRYNSLMDFTEFIQSASVEVIDYGVNHPFIAGPTEVKRDVPTIEYLQKLAEEESTETDSPPEAERPALGEDQEEVVEDVE